MNSIDLGACAGPRPKRPVAAVFLQVINTFGQADGRFTTW